jgi:hypothetical protein
MRLIFTFLLLFTTHVLLSQSVISTREFGNNRSLLVHELAYSKGLEDGFVLLKEERRGTFNFEKYDLNLDLQWSVRVNFDAQLDVPQLLIHEKKALLISYTVRELDRSVTIDLKNVDLETGKIISEAKHAFPQYQAKSPYPRISISNDLSKILLANYFPVTTGMPEINVISSEDLSIIKTVGLNKSIFDLPKINRFSIDNNGNVFFVSIDEPLFRMDGYFIPSAGTEVRILPNDILFSRPLDIVADVIIQAMDDRPRFLVAASGHLGSELIGVKMAMYDFGNNTISMDTTFNFSMVNIVDLYKESTPTSKYVKAGSLKTPTNLIGYNMQEMRVDSNENLFLMFEKNRQKSTYQRGFINGNLVYTYNTNTKRQIQKSEDIILLSFDKSGEKKWGRVIQKYQVTKPFNFYMSYVSDLTDDVLSVLTWTKRNRNSFQITQIESLTGHVKRSGVNLIKDGKYTYHKNYTTWINGKHVAITTQKNNKMNSRRIFVVEVD